MKRNFKTPNSTHSALPGAPDISARSDSPAHRGWSWDIIIILTGTKLMRGREAPGPSCVRTGVGHLFHSPLADC